MTWWRCHRFLTSVLVITNPARHSWELKCGGWLIFASVLGRASTSGWISSSTELVLQWSDRSAASHLHLSRFAATELSKMLTGVSVLYMGTTNVDAE